MMRKNGGGDYYGIPITSPYDIQKYEYDVILICSAYEYEIEGQLIYELNVDKEKIDVQPDLDAMVNKVWEKMEEWGGFDIIFLCSEVQQACERFKMEFGNKVF